MSDRGDIEHRREEILRLITKVQQHGQLRTRPRRTSSTNHSAPHPSRAKASPRKRESVSPPEGRILNTQSAELRARQDQLEHALRDVPTNAAIEGIEERLERIEELLLAQQDQRGAVTSSPAGDEEFTLAGKLDMALLADILQLVSTNSLSGVFSVESFGFEVQLYFHEGDICHAEGPDMEGESAVFAVLSLEGGRYRFCETTEPPPRRTIQSKTQFLILEGLRRVDETRAGAE